jgi:GNAT superfamily N-acetyltransferase
MSKALPDPELVAAEVHAAWVASKRAQGISSRCSETGEELMVPYAQLSEPAKDLDRNTVRAVYAAIGRAAAEGLQWSAGTEGLDWVELEALYRAAPLGNKTAAHLQTVFSNSRFKWFAREGGRLVAAGRALADGADAAYLCDIAVLPSHQGCGVGREVVARLLADVRGHKKILLYSVPGKEDFYRRLGFLPLQTAMAIFEDREAAIQRGHLRAD